MKTAIKICLLIYVFIFSACAKNEINKDDNTVNGAKTYHLEEIRQRVIRYNCKNEVTTDRTETTRAPTLRMSIQPNSFENLYGSSFENKTLNTIAGSITNHTDFTIDLNPGALNLEVQEGINQISYQFSYCSQLLPPPNDIQCAVTPDIRETGSVFINVTYGLTNLNETLEIRPTPDQCKTK